MNDGYSKLANNTHAAANDSLSSHTGQTLTKAAPEIPGYLQDTYWWAYLHPNSFVFFERKWVVNLILWG